MILISFFIQVLGLKLIFDRLDWLDRLTDSDVAVDVSGSGLGNSCSEFGVAKSGKAGSDSGDQEREDDGRTGNVFGHGPREDVDADPEGGPDPEGDEVEGWETFVELGCLLVVQSLDSEQALPHRLDPHFGFFKFHFFLFEKLFSQSHFVDDRWQMSFVAMLLTANALIRFSLQKEIS